MNDKSNIVKPVCGYALNDFGFNSAIIAIFSVVIAAIESFFDGLKINFPCFLRIFLGLALFSVPIASLFLIISIPLKWRRYSISWNITRLILLGIMLLFITSFVVFKLPNRLTNCGMRLLIERNGGTEELISWADSIMKKPLDQVVRDYDVTNSENAKSAMVKSELFSLQVKKIARPWVFLITKKQGKCIIIETGGGGFIDFGWGVVITSRDMQINNYPQTGKLFKWNDRVYGYIGNEWKLLFGPDEEGQ